VKKSKLLDLMSIFSAMALSDPHGSPFGFSVKDKEEKKPEEMTSFDHARIAKAERKRRRKAEKRRANESANSSNDTE